jgi:hypothetical protein
LALLNRFRQEGIDLPRVDWEAAQRAEPVA